MIKYLIILFIFVSCASSKNFSQRRSLMLLKTYEQPRNKQLNSKKEIKKKKKTYRKFKRLNK